MKINAYLYLPVLEIAQKVYQVYNARFIMAVPGSPNKRLSQSLTFIFNLFLKAITINKAVSFLVLISFGIFLTMYESLIPSAILTSTTNLHRYHVSTLLDFILRYPMKN